jgi:sugar lactone lactonase YvrE
MDYHDYTAGSSICYDAVHNYIWAVSNSHAAVEAYPANANGTDVPAVMTLQVGALNGYPTGCTVDSHGNVYVTAYGAIFSGIPDMVAIYPSGSTTAGTVIRGTNAGLNIPRKPAVDSAGNIYIPDDGSGKDVRVFANPGTNAGIIDVAPSRTISYAFTHPWNLTVDASGHIFVADTYGIAGYVEAFPAGTTNAAGSTPLLVIGSGIQIPSSPNGVAFDKDGNLWVACTGSLQGFTAYSITNALASGVPPNPFASIYGSLTKLTGASSIESH